MRDESNFLPALVQDVVPSKLATRVLRISKVLLRLLRGDVPDWGPVLTDEIPVLRPPEELEEVVLLDEFQVDVLPFQERRVESPLASNLRRSLAGGGPTRILTFISSGCFFDVYTPLAKVYIHRMGGAILTSH